MYHGKSHILTPRKLSEDETDPEKRLYLRILTKEEDSRRYKVAIFDGLNRRRVEAWHMMYGYPHYLSDRRKVGTSIWLNGWATLHHRGAFGHHPIPQVLRQFELLAS